MDRTLTPNSFLARAAWVGGIFVYLLSNSVSVTYGANQPEVVKSASTDLQISLRWIQPILGQAIVEDTLAKQQQRSWISDAIKPPDRPTIMAHRPTHVNLSSPSFAYAETLRADHVARVQWVTGRLIVELTRHRIQAGVSTADWLANEGNQQIIAIAQQTGERLNDLFEAAWQVRLGQAIVTETRNRAAEDVGLIF